MRLLTQFLLGTGALLLCATACSDNDPVFNPDSGSLVEEDGRLISIFNLKGDSADEFTGSHNVTFLITSPDSDEEYSFEGSVSPETALSPEGAGLRLLCRLILSDTTIPDGEYYISILGENLPQLGVFKVRFTDNIATQMLRTTPTYVGLQGHGTKTDPYQVGSADDFTALMQGLNDDPDHGFGVYFSQTESISLAGISQSLVATAPFHGTYDGNGFSITDLEWEAPSDGAQHSDIGLFTTMYNATVRNLVIEDANIIGVYQRGGILAGSASGTTVIDGLKMSGQINGAGECIGGVIGDAHGAIFVSGVSFSKGRVKGRDTHTGGIFGAARLGSVSSMKNIEVMYEVEVSGGDNTGGMIGYGRFGSTLNLDNIWVGANVEGRESVGGGIGYFSMVDAQSLISLGGTHNGFDSPSIIGDKSVGGFAGHIKGYYGKTLEFRAPIRLEANITAKGDNAGAIAGRAEYIYGMIVDNMTIPGIDIATRAQGNNAGGLIGYASGVSMSGTHTVDPYNLNGPLQPWEVTAATLQGSAKAGSYAGQIVGYADGNSTIEGFFVAGDAHADVLAAGGILGGGHDVTIRNCEYQGTISNPDLCGGLVGLVDGNFEMDLCNCTMDSRSTSKWQGGLIGYINTSAAKNSKIKIVDSYFCGMTCFGYTAGGIIGGIRADSSCDIRILRCGNFGAVYNYNPDNKYGSYLGVGGIVGMVDTTAPVTITNCFNAGTVYAQGKTDAVGGIVGIGGKDDNVTNYTVVEKCINLSSEVLCDDENTKLGGIVGHLVQGGMLTSNRSTIEYCVNLGAIYPDTKHDTGGILGYAAQLTLTRCCFNRGKVQHGNAIIGTHNNGTLIEHEYNYFLEGTGGSWPQSVSVSESKLTDKSVYKGCEFSSKDGTTGFVMTNLGPFPAGMPVGVRSRFGNPWPDLTYL